MDEDEDGVNEGEFDNVAALFKRPRRSVDQQHSLSCLRHRSHDTSGLTPRVSDRVQGVISPFDSCAHT